MTRSKPPKRVTKIYKELLTPTNLITLSITHFVVKSNRAIARVTDGTFISLEDKRVKCLRDEKIISLLYCRQYIIKRIKYT